MEGILSKIQYTRSLEKLFNLSILKKLAERTVVLFMGLNPRQNLEPITLISLIWMVIFYLKSFRLKFPFFAGQIMLYHYTDERGATGIANSAGIFEGSPKQNRGYVYGK